MLFRSKKNILVLSPFFYPEPISTGKYNTDIALKLQEEGHKVTVVYDFPIFVRGDKERIEQVLINLIVNSIKYGKINGITSVGIESYNENKFIIKVIDNGEGIKKEHIPRLFERFYRVDQSRSREQGGSGLGLSIVKHIVEAHNEKVLLKSTFKKGSEFSFTMKKVK